MNIDTFLCLSQGTAFLLSSRLDSAVKRCSSEVLKFSFLRCSVKGLARRNKTLGRALDPRANSTWLSKLTE